MCGRLTQQLSSAEIAELFGAEDLAGDAGLHFNVAPTQSVRVVVEHEARRAVTAYRWGLIPHWAQSVAVGSKMINARAETVAEKPAFKSAFRRHRCIVPADAFYEWKTEAKGKTPYAVRRTDDRPMAFAGLWSSWREPSSQERLLSCAIITTSANHTMAAIHERMPVILPENVWDLWLDPGVDDPALLQSLLVPAPDDLVRAYPVSPLVNNVRNDSPELLVRAG
ncbi:MAG TPA: SOS response-associated peptidase [Chloroflexota bacterium]|nr:SOS response-associated peptidase [Chloroflexota bacterium]